MTTQVLCVMENHTPSLPYYPLQSTIFSSGSDIETDKECESSESTFDISLNSTLGESEKKQMDKNINNNIAIKEKSLTEETEKNKEAQPKSSSQSSSAKNYPKMTLYALKNVTVGILSCVIQTSIGIMDFIYRFCLNEGVHNVLMVTLTVTVEVFVIMVFAVATILATIIINVDDAYQNRHSLKSKSGEHSKHIGDSAIPIKVRSSRTRTGRREKIRRTPKPSVLNVRVLEYNGNESDIEHSLREDTNNHCVNEISDQKPPLEGFDSAREASKYDTDDSTIHEDEDESEKPRSDSPVCGDSDAETLKCDAIESFSQQDPVISKQSTLYRTKLLTIQDNETLLKKKCFPTAKLTLTNKIFNDGAENKDGNDSFPIENFGVDTENKDPNLLTISNYNVLENEFASVLSVTECSESKCESGKTVEDTSMSFVSTKRMFENNKL